jgi:hypothetical protein
VGVAGSCAGDAGDDAEDGAEAVVDAVDGVADPTGGFGLALFAGGDQFVEGVLGEFGSQGFGGQVVADKAAEGDVVVGFVGEDFLEDGGAGVVAQLFDPASPDSEPS